MKHQIVPNLWFDGNAVEAANFYVSVFEGSRILSIVNYPEGAPGPAGEPMVVEWEMNGQRFMGINGGPEFPFSEAVSFLIECDTQEEIDLYWDKLLANGGEESVCGWLKDQFGLAWQVAPAGMDALFADPDKSKAERAMQAMLKMKKIDMATMQAAADGTLAPQS